MSITINLTPDEESKLLELAARNGQDVTAYVYRLIERDIKDVDEALGLFRRQVAESGISDEELCSGQNTSMVGKRGCPVMQSQR